MAYVLFHSSAPCGFLIVPDDVPQHAVREQENRTRLIDADWDFPCVASCMGFEPCSECRETDGTVKCAHRTPSEMIDEALAFLREHEGESFFALEDYLPID